MVFVGSQTQAVPLEFIIKGDKQPQVPLSVTEFQMKTKLYKHAQALVLAD